MLQFFGWAAYILALLGGGLLFNLNIEVIWQYVNAHPVSFPALLLFLSACFALGWWVLRGVAKL